MSSQSGDNQTALAEDLLQGMLGSCDHQTAGRSVSIKNKKHMIAYHFGTGILQRLKQLHNLVLMFFRGGRSLTNKKIET